MFTIIAFTYLFLLIPASSALQLNFFERAALNNRLENIKFEARNRLQEINERKTENLILIFPGADGPDQFTEELELQLLANVSSERNISPSPISNIFSPARGQKKKKVPQCNVKTLDWKEFRGSLLTAAYDGEAFGEVAASIVCGDGDDDEGSQLRSVHCIGISVGVFAANACATEINRLRQRRTSSSAPYLRLTLLDPFTSRGLFGSGYGVLNFGKSVDYAEQYLNTDDPVPTTNKPLPLCACIDVTAAKERKSFKLPENETMHCWPLVYFTRFGLKDSAGKILLHSKDGNPSRGSVLNA